MVVLGPLIHWGDSVLRCCQNSQSSHDFLRRTLWEPGPVPRPRDATADKAGKLPCASVPEQPPPPLHPLRPPSTLLRSPRRRAYPGHRLSAPRAQRPAAPCCPRHTCLLFLSCGCLWVPSPPTWRPIARTLLQTLPPTLWPRACHFYFGRAPPHPAALLAVGEMACKSLSFWATCGDCVGWAEMRGPSVLTSRASDLRPMGAQTWCVCPASAPDLHAAPSARLCPKGGAKPDTSTRRARCPHPAAPDDSLPSGLE